MRRFAFGVLGVAMGAALLSAPIAVLAGPAPKIAIYSGTFDPPHIGHEALVRAIKQKLGVDIVYVIPNPTSDHKSGVLPYADRLEMSREAFGKIDGVKLPDDEMVKAFQKGDMSEVINVIHQRHPDASLSQVMGDDSFERYLKLKDVPEKPKRTIVVVPREGMAAMPTEAHGFPVRQLDVAPGEIPKFSSSRVRFGLFVGRTPEGLSEGVSKLIGKRGFYSPPLAGVGCERSLSSVVGALKGAD